MVYTHIKSFTVAVKNHKSMSCTGMYLVLAVAVAVAAAAAAAAAAAVHCVPIKRGPQIQNK